MQSRPGHIFELVYNGVTATWTNLDTGVPPLGDLPVPDTTGRSYTAADFGVITSNGGPWTVARTGLPNVESRASRSCPASGSSCAATHGAASGG